MKRIRLRKYQSETVAKALAAGHPRNRVLIVSPGGSGKTVMISKLAQQLHTPRKCALIVAHRREIINQCYNHLLALGSKPYELGTIMAEDDRHNPKAKIQLATMATMNARDTTINPAAILVDEAHHAPAPTYLNLLDSYQRAQEFGFTATPFRLDGLGLGGVFDELIEAIRPSELIKKKWMAKPLIYTADERYLPNLKKIRTIHGDYSLATLEERVAKHELVGDIVRHWHDHAGGRTTLVFATSIAHSQMITERFKADGIFAAHLDGHASNEEREGILESFAENRIQVLSSCMLLSEGYDLPKCDAIILARPTKSMALALQQVNRGLRYHKGTTPVILDHACHYMAFGLPYADREYTLHGTTITPSGGAPAKECPKCHAVVGIRTKCCDCGYEFQVAVIHRTEPSETGDELIVLTGKKALEFKARLEAFAKAKGHPSVWVNKVLEHWVDVRTA